MPSTLRRFSTVVTVVVAGHGVLLSVAGLQRRDPAGATLLPAVMSTRWLVPPAPQDEPARLAPPTRLAPQAATARRARSVASRLPGEAVPAAAEAAAVPPPDTAAAPWAEPALRLDGVGRAAREVSQRPGLAARSDALLGAAPPSAQARLESGVAASAKADCIGPERGMSLGLFALPLMVIDAAAGRCK